MAKTSTVLDIPLHEKPALSPAEATALTPIGLTKLMGYINSGRLKAKRNADANGRGTGNYVILRKDLDAFLDSLPDA